jgi:hypothetical protein
MALLDFRYFVEMPWPAAVPAKEVATTRAYLLRNRFLAEKMEMLERSCREGMRVAGTPF